MTDFPKCDSSVECAFSMGIKADGESDPKSAGFTMTVTPTIDPAVTKTTPKDDKKRTAAAYKCYQACDKDENCLLWQFGGAGDCNLIGKTKITDPTPTLDKLAPYINAAETSGLGQMHPRGFDEVNKVGCPGAPFGFQLVTTPTSDPKNDGFVVTNTPGMGPKGGGENDQARIDAQKKCCSQCGGDCFFWQLGGAGDCNNIAMGSQTDKAKLNKYLKSALGLGRGQFKVSNEPVGTCADCNNCPLDASGVCIGTNAATISHYERVTGYQGGPKNWIICNGQKQVATVPFKEGARVSDQLKSNRDPSSNQTKGLCSKIQISDWTPGGDPQTASYGTDKLVLDNGYCLASITKIPRVVDGNIEHVEVKDLKDGDMIRTTRGDFPLSHIMHTTTIGPHTYVKVEQGALGENLPSQDLYITHEHSFSLGYYKNSTLNRNIHDPDQDDMVYLHITADQLADKLPGITRVQKEFDSMFNLVFDEHVSLDIYGLEVMMHHPKGVPYTLPEEKYQDKTKINNKVQKPLFARYHMLETVKPDHMEMKDFLRNCITANLDNKFRLEDVHHPNFTPQKTMLTEDMREKLRVN